VRRAGTGPGWDGMGRTEGKRAAIAQTENRRLATWTVVVGSGLRTSPRIDVEDLEHGGRLHTRGYRADGGVGGTGAGVERAR